MADQRSPHHIAALPGQDQQLDPAAEYRRITGRDPEDDALPGRLLAGLIYAREWFGTACSAALGALDVGYRPTLATVGPAKIAPLPEWVRLPVWTWAAYAQQTGMSDEKQRQIGLFPPHIISDVLADPPLRLTLSFFALARGLFIAGQAVVHGDPRPSLEQLVGEPLRDLLRLGFMVRPELTCESEPGELTLDFILSCASAARAAIAQGRQIRKKRRATPGPARDFVARAFHQATVNHRLPETTDPIHLALLEAVAGIEVISTREGLNRAVRKWHNRIGRFTAIGPLPDLPNVPADIADRGPVHGPDPGAPNT